MSNAGALVRSVLFVPGDDERKLAKCAAVPADVVIVDLEDAVAESRKALAASMLASSVQRLRAGRSFVRVFVRVNGFATGRTSDEVVAACEAGADGVVLPKATTCADVKTVTALIDDRVGDGAAVSIVPLVETAAGVLRAAEIAGASPRVERLAFGIGDLTSDLGLDRGDEPGYATLLDSVRATLVIASRSAGVGAPLEGPMLAVRDVAAFGPHCVNARGMGFAGVLCLHPDQVGIANDVFSPSPAAVARAKRIVEAFEASESDGLASIVVDGVFVDYPIAASARALVARSGAISDRTAISNDHREELR